MSINVGDVIAHMRLNTTPFESGLTRVNTMLRATKDRAEQDFGRVTAVTDRLANSFIGLGMASGGLAIGASAVAARWEQVNMAFATLLKSPEKAKALLGDLTAFSLKSGQQVMTVVQQAQALMNAGIQPDKLVNTMRGIAGAAAASGRGAEGFTRIAMAISQIQAKGQVMGEEMNQQLGELMPAWDMLAEKIGKSKAELIKMASRGELKAEMAVPALIEAMNERYGKLVDQQQNTLLGKWNSFITKLQLKATQGGESGILGLAKGIVDGVSRLVDVLDKVNPRALAWGAGLLIVAGGALKLLPLIVQLRNATAMLAAARALDAEAAAAGAGATAGQTAGLTGMAGAARGAAGALLTLRGALVGLGTGVGYIALGTALFKEVGVAIDLAKGKYTGLRREFDNMSGWEKFKTLVGLPFGFYQTDERRKINFRPVDPKDTVELKRQVAYYQEYVNTYKEALLAGKSPLTGKSLTDQNRAVFESWISQTEQRLAKLREFLPEEPFTTPSTKTSPFGTTELSITALTAKIGTLTDEMNELKLSMVNLTGEEWDTADKQAQEYKATISDLTDALTILQERQRQATALVEVTSAGKAASSWRQKEYDLEVKHLGVLQRARMVGGETQRIVEAQVEAEKAALAYAQQKAETEADYQKRIAAATGIDKDVLQQELRNALEALAADDRLNTLRLKAKLDEASLDSIADRLSTFTNLYLNRNPVWQQAFATARRMGALMGNPLQAPAMAAGAGGPSFAVPPPALPSGPAYQWAPGLGPGQKAPPFRIEVSLSGDLKATVKNEVKQEVEVRVVESQRQLGMS